MNARSDEFEDLNAQMLLRLMEINPDCATIFGMHDPYDRHLPHGGFKKIRDNLGLLDEWYEKSQEIAANGELSRNQKTSLSVLKFTLETYRFAVDDYPIWKMRPEAIEHPGTAMLMMIVRDYAPMTARLDAISERLGEMPRYLGQFRERFAGVKPVRMWTEAALETCKSFPSFLESAENMSRAHSDAKSRSLMAEAISHVKEELLEHTAWLEALLDSSVEEFAMGRDRYAKLMRIRGIPFTPEELLVLAAEYLKQYKTRRLSVVERISAGGSIEQARKALEGERPNSLNEAVERTKMAVARAKDFVIQNDMVSMPMDSKIHVMKTPEFLGGSTPWAATYLPAVFEKSQETVFVVGCSDDSDAIGKTYNNYVIDDTAVHEAYPGHHHQGVMSNRKPWVHQLPHIMYTPETVSPPYESQEGWATYCECVMEERGFLGSDKHILTTLDYSIWTACRVFSDVKLSCGEATVEEMIDFTTRESGYPRDFCEADVKGFTLVPSYGMCYLVGRHDVNKLKKDLQVSLGPRFSEKRFHDLVAENGNLPFCILENEVREGVKERGRT